MSQSEIIEGIATISYREDNILVMHNADSIDLEAANKITPAASKLAGDLTHSNLVDIRKMAFMGSDARKHFGGQDKTTVKAVAILSNPSFHRPLVNLYLKFSRPTLPTKTFSSEEEAIQWLLESLE